MKSTDRSRNFGFFLLERDLGDFLLDLIDLLVLLFFL